MAPWRPLQTCNFKRPLVFPDILIVGTRVVIESLSSDRFQLQSIIYSVNSNSIAADGLGKVVCYNYPRSQKTSLPDIITRCIRILNSST